MNVCDNRCFRFEENTLRLSPIAHLSSRLGSLLACILCFSCVNSIIFSKLNTASYFVQFYNTTDVDEHFMLMKLCAEYMTKDINGLWKEGEILFHLNTEDVSSSEMDAIINFIFRSKSVLH